MEIKLIIDLETLTTNFLLEYILYIHYPIQFKKDQVKTQALIDSDNKVNTITLAYTQKLGFQT